MFFFTLLDHLINFVQPAFWIATAILVTHWMLYRKRPQPVRWWRQWLWLFGSGVAVLLIGLVIFQRDGKMLTYVALVFTLGIIQARFAWKTIAYSKKSEPIESSAEH